MINFKYHIAEVKGELSEILKHKSFQITKSFFDKLDIFANEVENPWKEIGKGEFPTVEGNYLVYRAGQKDTHISKWVVDTHSKDDMLGKSRNGYFSVNEVTHWISIPTVRIQHEKTYLTTEKLRDILYKNGCHSTRESEKAYFTALNQE